MIRNHYTPHTLAVRPENLPDPLKTGRRFVAWRWTRRDGKWTKPPINAETGALASVDDPDTWTDFETALAFDQAQGLAGVGIVLTGEGLVGIDVDHCFTESGKLTTEAAAIVSHFDTYTERSPSGKGLRLFVRSQLPPGRRRRGNIEAYDSGRFVTLTGQIYGKPRPIAERQTELNEWHAAALGEQPQREVRERPPEHTSGRQSAGSLTDDEILARVNPERYAADPRHASDSERDLSFTTHIAFYAGPGNTAQVESVWRASGLWREKCERHDYVTRTIEKALKRGTFYQPPAPPAETWKHAPPPVSGGSATAADDVVCITTAEYNALRAQVDTLRAENAELRKLTSRAAQIRRNKGLRGSKDTAAALVFELSGQTAGEDGFYQVLYPRLADSAGVSDDTAGRDLKRFATAGLLDRETRRIVCERANPETGELVKTIEPRVFVRPAGSMTPLELAERFAAVNLKTNHGGPREPRPCPVCKEDAGTTITHTETCNACSATVVTWQTKRVPAAEDSAAEREPQVAVYDSIPPSVVDCSLLPQVAVYATEAPPEATPERKPHVAAYVAGGLVDLVRDTSPGDGSDWYGRENERRQWLENSLAIGGD